MFDPAAQKSGLPNLFAKGGFSADSVFLEAAVLSALFLEGRCEGRVGSRTLSLAVWRIPTHPVAPRRHATGEGARQAEGLWYSLFGMTGHPLSPESGDYNRTGLAGCDMTTERRISDPAKAIIKVDWFIEFIEENRNPLAGWEGQFLTNRDEPPPCLIWDLQGKGFVDYERWIKQKVVELQPFMEEIASRIDPIGESGRLAEHESDGWDRAEAAARRLRGKLVYADEMSEILGPIGPVLNAERLHPWVWNAAVNLWDNGHYKEGVLAAANAVEQQTQLKLSSPATGYKLYTQAFAVGEGTSSPRLRSMHLSQIPMAGLQLTEEPSILRWDVAWASEIGLLTPASLF